MTHKPIYEIGQRFERDGTWEVVSTQPYGILPNRKVSLDELVFARNVRVDDTLGKYQAVFWALELPDKWHVFRL